MSGIGRRSFLGAGAAAVGSAVGLAARPLQSWADAHSEPRAGARATAAAQPGPAGQRLSVIVYHSIRSRADFAHELDWLQSWNYQPVTIDQVSAFLSGTGTLPTKPLLIAFDDGYASQYHYAWSELSARGVTAVLYVCTGWVDGILSQTQGDFSEPHAMTWTQLRSMQESQLVSVQSHTVHHRRLIEMSPAGIAQEYNQAKARIEKMVPGAVVSHLAYPFGAWDESVRQTLGGLGCRTARVVTNPAIGYGFYGYTDSSTDPLALPCAGGGFADVAKDNFYRLVVPQDQLCPDYSFEAGAKGWTLGPGFSVVTGGAYTGQRWLRALAMGSVTSSYSTTVIPVQPGSSLHGSVATLLTAASTRSMATVTCQVIAGDGRTTVSTIEAATQSGPTGGWAVLPLAIDLPAHAAFVRLHLNFDPAGQRDGWAGWDQIVLQAA